MTQNNRVPRRVILGYATGAVGYSLGATSFFVFFLFFLTTVAGFNPAIGGLIVFIAVSWDAITDPSIGFLSDRYRSRHGTRRPFILWGSLPFGVLTVFLFTNVTFLDGTAKLTYFIAVNILFWVCFTTVDIPWAALGSELTDDYNEKTRIRTASSINVHIGSLLSMIGAPLLIAYGAELFGSEAMGWTFAATIAGTVILAAYLTSWSSTRGYDSKEEAAPESAHPETNIFRNIGGTLMNRSMKYLVGAVLFMAFGYSGLCPAVLLFLMEYNLGIVSGAEQSFYMGIYAVSAGILTPVAGWISIRFSDKVGKAKTLGVFGVIAATILISGKIAGVTPTVLVVLLAAIGLGQAAFWVFIYVLAYDVAAVENYKTGDNREGIVVSIMSFIQKLGMALGVGVSGVLLEVFGFDQGSAVQTPGALAGIETVFCLFSGVVILAGAAFCFGFPVTQKKYEAMKKASAQKALGEPYSEDGFADLL